MAATTIHLREADADVHQEWKSTLAVAPTDPLEPPRTHGTFNLAEEIRDRKCAHVPGALSLHSDPSGLNPRLASPWDSDRSRLALWDVFVGGGLQD